MEVGVVMMIITQGVELSCLLGMATQKILNGSWGGYDDNYLRSGAIILHGPACPGQKILNGSWGGYDDDDYLRSGAIIFQGPACPGQKMLICEVELRGLG